MNAFPLQAVALQDLHLHLYRPSLHCFYNNLCKVLLANMEE